MTRILEINAGIIVGCMPNLPILFHHERGVKCLNRCLTSTRSKLPACRNGRSESPGPEEGKTHGVAVQNMEKNGDRDFFKYEDLEKM